MDIKTQITDVSPIRKEIEITVTGADVEQTLSNVYSSLSHQVKIKGFRKGKVPRYVLEKYYKQDAETEALKRLVQKCIPLALQENELRPVTEPELLSVPSIVAGLDLTFKAALDLPPDFSLVDLASISVEKVEYSVGEEDVNSQLESLRQKHATLTPVEDRSSIQKNDVVTCDITATESGQTIESLSQNNFVIEVGSGRYYTEAEDALLNAKLHKSVSAKITLPESMGDENLAGKEIELNITPTIIKTNVLPELNDDFAQDIDESFTTLDLLKEKVQEHLKLEAEKRSKEESQEKVVDALIAAHNFEVPQSLVYKQAQEIALRPFEQFPKEQLYSLWQQFGEQMTQESMPKATRQVQGGFLVDKIRNEMQVELSDDERDAYFKKLADQNGQNVAQIKNAFKEAGKLENLDNQLIAEKSLELVFTKAKVKTIQKPVRSLWEHVHDENCNHEH